MLRLRALQDETGGFQVFIPLRFHNEHNRMAHLPMATAEASARAYAADAPVMVEEVLASFRRSLRDSLARVDEIALAASRWEPFPAPVLADYFRTLRFEFGPRYQDGLREFARHAAARGALRRVPDLEFFHPRAGAAAPATAAAAP